MFRIGGRGLDMSATALVIWAILALGYGAWIIRVNRNNPPARVDGKD